MFLSSVFKNTIQRNLGTYFYRVDSITFPGIKKKRLLFFY